MDNILNFLSQYPAWGRDAKKCLLNKTTYDRSFLGKGKHSQSLGVYYTRFSTLHLVGVVVDLFLVHTKGNYSGAHTEFLDFSDLRSRVGPVWLY